MQKLFNIQSLPFATGFADVTISGHVIGDDTAREISEMTRITKQGGIVILCPGNIDADNEVHTQLVKIGYHWSTSLEPGVDFGSGNKRKYWKIKD